VRGLFDNLGLKAASLGFAVLLWFAIGGEVASEVGLSVPIELHNVPVDMEVSGELVSTVQVRLRGSSSIVQRLGPRDVSAHLDLSNYGEGEHIEHLTADSVRVPFGVSVLSISPAIVTLHLERTLTKAVRIEPRVVGALAPGYEIAETASDPREILVAGPSSRVRETESAFTEPVPVDGAQMTLVRRVNLGLADPALRIQGSPRVRVTVVIREVHGQRTFKSLPIAVRGGSARLRPSRVTVALTGPKSVLERITQDQVRPYVVLEKGLTSGAVPVTVELSEVEGIVVHETDPAEVTVLARRGAGG
jgi:YbbR domain-containing protein